MCNRWQALPVFFAQHCRILNTVMVCCITDLKQQWGATDLSVKFEPFKMWKEWNLNWPRAGWGGASRWSEEWTQTASRPNLSTFYLCDLFCMHNTINVLHSIIRLWLFNHFHCPFHQVLLFWLVSWWNPSLYQERCRRREFTLDWMPVHHGHHTYRCTLIHTFTPRSKLS